MVAVDQIERFFVDLHAEIRDTLESVDGKGRFLRDRWTRAPGDALAGNGESAVLEGGAVVERGAVMYSRVEGSALPPAATVRHPEVVGQPYVAMGVSVVVHPLNPHVPTSHMNVRFLSTRDGGAWWFGGGFDLTPFYPVDDDIRHWHRTARALCEPFGAHVYPALKTRCDDYFFLTHRNETRGVGGLFVEDLSEKGEVAVGDRNRCWALTQAMGRGYLDAYKPIVERRKDDAYGERERTFQLMRRGRYVEFNLVLDRGTHFGLQSHGRTDSILASMPPLASWTYSFQAPPGSAEARLSGYLTPRDWL